MQARFVCAGGSVGRGHPTHPAPPLTNQPIALRIAHGWSRSCHAPGAPSSAYACMYVEWGAPKRQVSAVRPSGGERERERDKWSSRASEEWWRRRPHLQRCVSARRPRRCDAWWNRRAVLAPPPPRPDRNCPAIQASCWHCLHARRTSTLQTSARRWKRAPLLGAPCSYIVSSATWAGYA